MTITSLTFVLFIIATLIVYYIVPKRFQWIVLLVSSTVFYLASGVKGILYVLLTSATVYGAAIFMQTITDRQKLVLRNKELNLTKEEKSELKTRNRKVCRGILIGTLVLNFGIMCVLKYAHLAVFTINTLFKTDIYNSFYMFVPLGLSFYTFQAAGYLINVYWNRCNAEKSFFRLLLFVSFFPQMTQGPISEYEQLSEELFSEHSFDYKNYSWGFQRLIWGFAKKILLADALAPWVKSVFANYDTYAGVTVLIGAFMYSVQIYADFSGYMDIMCGYCEMLGIRLTENFERPYFSKSVAEYWRRWHITLGAWFKNYIYYPIGISKWNRALGKKLTSKFGKSVGKNLPATIALIAVWFLTGLWHGATWEYIAWGGVNGFFIILSMWLEPVYAKTKKLLRVRESSWIWRAFSTVRTFLLVTFIKVLPEVGDIGRGFGLWKRVFTDYTVPDSFNQLFPFVENKRTLVIVIIFTALIFVSSLLQRRKPIREYFNKIPWVARVLILAAVFLMICVFGDLTSEITEGFMYANF